MRQRDRYRIGKQPVRVSTGYTPPALAPAEVEHERDSATPDLISTLTRRAEELRSALADLECRNEQLGERINALKAYLAHASALEIAERAVAAHADLAPVNTTPPEEPPPWLRSA